jgi:hypothetical protein
MCSMSMNNKATACCGMTLHSGFGHKIRNTVCFKSFSMFMIQLWPIRCSVSLTDSSSVVEPHHLCAPAPPLIGLTIRYAYRFLFAEIFDKQ